ncbi:MAG: 2'-5' RNA ligase family protein, partial [Bacteroidales bacterium]
MKRLFAAIKVMPDEEFMRVFMTLKRDLKNEKIKWVDPENIHITLKFFGETPESKIPLINDVLSAV